MVEHQVLIVAVAALLATISSGYAAFVLGTKWNLSVSNNNGPGQRFFLMGCSGIAAAVLAGFASNAAIEWGGLPSGVIADILTAPAVGLVWIFIVGGNKAVERMLNGIDIRLSK